MEQKYRWFFIKKKLAHPTVILAVIKNIMGTNNKILKISLSKPIQFV